MAQKPLEKHTYGAFVDGTERPVGDEFDIENPATKEQLAVVASSSASEVTTAIDAAEAALKSWEAWDPNDRARLLYKIGKRIREQQDRLARIETLETGRSISTSRNMAEEAAKYFEYYGGLADKIQGETIPIPGNNLDYTQHEPLGVTAHIVPWDAALLLFARSIAPALACGNTAVVKPPSKAPLSLLELTALISEAGLPDGILNSVPGSAGTVGETLLTDERINGITFTGSNEVGQDIMRTAADRVVPVGLELGGKSPSIVFPDADLDRAVQGTVNAFWNAGQICYNTTRIFVHEEIYDEFLDRVTDEVETLSIGPGIDDHDVGPLITADAKANVEQYVEDAIENGGNVVTGGNVPRDDGHYYAPTIIDDVSDDAPVSCEEVFGPLLTAYRFSSDEEVLRRANDSRFGLYSAVWTQDLDRAHTAANELKAATVAINEFPMAFPQAPFGGYKESGLGREKGMQAMHHYTQLKNVIVSLSRGDDE